MKSTQEKKILDLINTIETVHECIKNKQYIDELVSIKNNSIKLEDYLDVYPDKNLDSSYYKLFGYDDEDIFEIDYQFLIENIY